MPDRGLSVHARLWLWGVAAAATAVVAAAMASNLVGGSLVRQMIYPAPPIEVPSPPPEPLMEVDLTLADGTQVAAWHLPPPGPAAIENPSGGANRPAMLFFHGNGENLGTMLLSGFFDELSALGVPVLAVDYPGYGRSGGRPSEAALAAAAELA